MVTCSVIDCCTTQRNNPEKSSFHRFPTNLDTRNAWLRLIDRQNWIPKKNSCVCSKHFEEKYFQIRGAKRILMKSAIPTKFVPLKIEPRRTVSSYVYRDIVPEASISIPSSSHSRSTPPLLQQSTPSTSFQLELTPRKKKLMSKCTKLHEKIKKKQQLIRNLRAQNKRTKNKVLTLASLLDEIQKRPGLKDHLNDIAATCCNKTIQALNDRANAVIRGDISQSATYCDELKTFALTVHFYSPRSYSYIREKFSFCLPHENTLRNWYKRVDCAPGFTAESFNTIKEVAKTKDLLVSVTFDEMSIKECTEFVGKNHYGHVNFGNDSHGDEVPVANQVLVFMVVAINHFWKLPVGFFPGRSFTATQKENLLKICLTFLTETGCTVASITFDGISSNLNMCKLLGCKFTTESIIPYFYFKNRKYYVLFDPCHLIKLIRGIFNDKKTFIDYDGRKVEFKFVTELYNLQVKEGLRLANKLTFRHINFIKQKMKVKLAVQLLSESVATSIEYCQNFLNLLQFQNSEATVTFIRMVNEIFDIFNSRNFLSYGFKKPLFERNKEIIFQKIDQVYDYFCNLKYEDGTLVINSSRHLGFSGFLVNIRTLKWLYVDYIEKGPLKSLPLYKLSQDHVETFFSVIRSKGGFNNNPTVRNFVSAYKRLLCHTEVKLSECGNCLELEKVTILNGVTSTTDRINCSIIFNKMKQEFEIQDDPLEKEQEDISQISELDILPDSSEDFTQFVKSVVQYIAGFVIKKIRRSIHCEVCSESLIQARADSLISRKDFDKDGVGFLIYPSEDVIAVCLQCEKYFREKLKTNFDFDKKKFDKTVLDIIRHIDLGNHFDSLVVHSFDQDPLNSHRYLIIKCIIETYLPVRLRYETKLKNVSKLTLRNYLNKIILFRGQ